MNPKDYPVEIRPLSADDGGGWLATFPDLPGCVGDCDTPEAAVADGYDAAQAWLSVAAECGDPVPKSLYTRLVVISRASGQRVDGSALGLATRGNGQLGAGLV